MKIITLFVLSLMLFACSEVKHKYRDTTDLETPPRLNIVEQSGGEKPLQHRKTSPGYVLLEDAENPPVLKIKKLFDRSWDIVGLALNKKKIEITDKNRDKGIYFVKYLPADDSATVFGNVKIFLFEPEYQEAEYELSVRWHDTVTEVRAKLKAEQEISYDDDEDEPGDASAKLIKTLYDVINEQLTE